MGKAVKNSRPQRMDRKKSRRRSAFIGLDDYPLDIHGVQEFFRNGRKFNKRKAFWLTVILISAAFGAYSCYCVTYEYTSNSTATRITLKQVNFIPLPKLTICAEHPDTFKATEVFEYLANTFPNATNKTLAGFLQYFTAGSGFQKLNGFVYNKNESANRVEYDKMYRKVRGNRNVTESFHHFFDNFGLNCRDLFKKRNKFNKTGCRRGDKYLNCCDIFEVSYTVRRGRCLSLKPMDQVKADDLGKLTLLMHHPNWLLNDDKQNLVVFVSDHLLDVAPFPRYFVLPNHFSKLRVQARKIILLNNDASKCLGQEHGKGTCYLNRSLGLSHAKFNCTPPYWPMTDDRQPMEACEPKLIIDNYRRMVTDEEQDQDLSEKTPCVRPCKRWEYTVIWEDSVSQKAFSQYGYQLRLEMSYNDLQYGELEEIKTVTFWGFVSQIGGQSGLFLGCSIISVFQLGLFLGLFIKKTLTDWIVARRCSKPARRGAKYNSYNRSTDRPESV